MVTVYGYKKCSTCTKAKKYLSDQGKDVNFIDMVEETPTADELRDIINKSSDDIDKYFNTRGKKFKDLELKDKLPTMTDEEKLETLATDGMLIKRPIVVSGDDVVLGFNEETYKATFNL